MRSIDVGRDRHALRARDRLDLATAVEKPGTDASSAQSGPIGSRAAPVKAASGHEQDELLPDRHAAVVDGLDLDVGRSPTRRRCARTRSDSRGRSPNTSPKTMRRWVPVCSITPGSTMRGRDVGRAADDRPLAVARRQLGDAVHAVLQRQDRRIAARASAHQRQRRRVVVRLHRDQHDVDAADRAWSSSAAARTMKSPSARLRICQARARGSRAGARRGR